MKSGVLQHASSEPQIRRTLDTSTPMMAVSQFLYILSIVECSKPTDDFAHVMHNLNDMACRIFGRHGSTPEF